MFWLSAISLIKYDNPMRWNKKKTWLHAFLPLQRDKLLCIGWVFRIKRKRQASLNWFVATKTEFSFQVKTVSFKCMQSHAHSEIQAKKKIHFHHVQLTRAYPSNFSIECIIVVPKKGVKKHLALKGSTHMFHPNVNKIQRIYHQYCFHISMHISTLHL